MRGPLRFRRWAWAMPCLIFVLAFEWAPRTKGRDLLEFPDAAEYGLVAQRLAHGLSPLLPIGTHLYPSRYPLAFPVLLAPFDRILGDDLRRIYLGSAFFGLLAVAMIARTGSWLTGSRLAGALGALFFALHPATLQASTQAMSETALIAMLFVALELARPWLDPHHAKPGGAGRAAALGLALGWLTIAKAIFVFWAAALAGVLFWKGFRSRRWRPAAAVAGAGLLCFFADLLYRRWAFGGGAPNGYAYWKPDIYGDMKKVFNPDFLFGNDNTSEPNVNAVYYGKLLTGVKTDFFWGRNLPLAAIIAAVAGLWPFRRGRPSKLTMALALGWSVTAGAFCALYFFQSPRFPYLWMPALDLLVAWGLVCVPFWKPLRRGAARKMDLLALGRIVALLAAAVILRGEIKALRAAFPPETRGWHPSYLDRALPMLGAIPPDAWLFTNYQAPLIQAVRPGRGPTAALNIWRTDSFLMNGHADDILTYSLQPRGENPAAKDWIEPVPEAWRSGPALLIGLDDRWRLTPEELDRLLAKPAYVLAVDPPDFPATGMHFEGTIRPLLEREGSLEPIQKAKDVTLYKLERNGRSGAAAAAP